MAHPPLKIPYNRHLGDLETLLAGVERSGDFQMNGILEAPMPRLEVEGLGLVSFPVPASQARDLMAMASQAPYGRGESTVVDPSVRRTWQIPADRIRLSGSGWTRAFDAILAKVAEGLGCDRPRIEAELYKLLLYETGGFFKAHRDTEKSPGMFGTLVVVLPSAHRGGELVVRHAGREQVVDLSSGEFSELRFAAFYADCEHEVRPVVEGHRVCLVFNLIQVPGETTELVAPEFMSAAKNAAVLLRKAFEESSGVPAKLGWLLEHQYSPSALSFLALKGEDAARVRVLQVAAERVGCVAHLAIVHIHEAGSAIPTQEGYGRRRGSGWNRNDEYDETVGSDRFEIVDVAEASVTMDQWIDPEGRSKGFGTLPVEAGELLPNGALDADPPDEQRLMEATGNEGASYERSYHRAALVLWPRDRFVSVLMQAGSTAAIPYLEEQIHSGDPGARDTAEVIVQRWVDPVVSWRNPADSVEAVRGRMLGLLVRLAEKPLLQEFLETVLETYTDKNAKTVVAALRCLGPTSSLDPLRRFVRQGIGTRCSAVVGLLGSLKKPSAGTRYALWAEALRDLAGLLVDSLDELGEEHRRRGATPPWSRPQEAILDAQTGAMLFSLLKDADTACLRKDAAEGLIQTGILEPVEITVPMLRILHEDDPGVCTRDPAARLLWTHAAGELLRRSEHPPVAPKDWRQDAKLRCSCPECRTVKSFMADPEQRVLRLRIAQAGRYHVAEELRNHGADIECRTEETGRPYALVCTKNRKSYEEACRRNRTDRDSMKVMIPMMAPVPPAETEWISRLAKACAP